MFHDGTSATPACRNTYLQEALPQEALEKQLPQKAGTDDENS
jgi:hypothetical protein